LFLESEKELERIVNETVSRDGSLLVPAFAVGRTHYAAVVSGALIRMRAGSVLTKGRAPGAGVRSWRSGGSR
jgi:predicted metal-dependent RNase